VTSPPDGFGAHDGGAAGVGDFLQAGDTVLEGLGFHVVGVASEGGVAPDEVVGIGAGGTAAAEFQ